jgi:hypothetical protein
VFICVHLRHLWTENSIPSISLTVIVEDEAASLPAGLASVAGLFDEIVFVATGSVDRTREIACEFGARVFDFACVDDYAAAPRLRGWAFMW